MTATRNRELCEDLTHDDLLRHYVQGAQMTVGSIDQLGNFLMGFGVLALGYLLNADLAPATSVFGVAGAGHHISAVLTLASWGVAVGLLVCFVMTYVFRVLAGRAVHARDGREEAIGDVIEVPDDLSYEQFMRHQGSFDQFLTTRRCCGCSSIHPLVMSPPINRSASPCQNSPRAILAFENWPISPARA